MGLGDERGVWRQVGYLGATQHALSDSVLCSWFTQVLAIQVVCEAEGCHTFPGCDALGDGNGSVTDGAARQVDGRGLIC